MNGCAGFFRTDCMAIFRQMEQIINDRFRNPDPTYINAPMGMTMPDMDNASAFIVVL